MLIYTLVRTLIYILYTSKPRMIGTGAPVALPSGTHHIPSTVLIITQE